MAFIHEKLPRLPLSIKDLICKAIETLNYRLFA